MARSQRKNFTIINSCLFLFLLCSNVGAQESALNYEQIQASIKFDSTTGNYNIQYYSENLDSVINKVFEPSTKISPSIACSVIAYSKFDSLIFRYTVNNGSQSEQRLSYVELRITGNVLSTIAPTKSWKTSWFGWVPILSFADFKDEAGLPHPYDGIAPDSSLSGYAVISNGLPIISDIYFKGRAKIYLTYPDEGPPKSIKDSLRTLQVFPGDRIQKRTLAPKTIPKPFDPLTFIDSLVSMGNEAEDLGWIENRWEDLKSNLKIAHQNIKRGSITKALNVMKNLLNEVEFIYDQKVGMTSEGYALMKYNGEYLLNYLIELKSKSIGE